MPFLFVSTWTYVPSFFRLPVTTAQKDAEINTRWTIPVVTRRHFTNWCFPTSATTKLQYAPRSEEKYAVV